jgi:hypothetical protein
MKTKKMFMLVLALLCVAGAWAQLDTSKKYTIANRNDLNVLMQDNGCGVVALGVEGENSYWAFIPTGKANCYYIRNTVTGKYIQSSATNLQEVALADEPVEFYVAEKTEEGEGMYGLASTDQATFDFTAGTYGLNWKAKADTGREFDTVQGFAAVAGTNHRSFWKLVAQDVPVAIVENLATYTGGEPMVFNQADNKFYALNNLCEYEPYGVYSRVNSLNVARKGITQIDYIQVKSDMGTKPYINTGYIFKANTRIVMECDIEGSTQAYQAPFGARSNYGADMFVFFWRFNNQNHGCFARNHEIQGTVDIPTGEKIKVDANAMTLNIFRDGADTPISTITDTEESKDGNRPIYIFDLCHNDHPDNSAAPMKLYTFKIYEGETLIKDYVPAINAEGAMGLYDKVNNQFVGSANSGKFASTPEAEAMAADAGISVYEGKRVIKDGVEYKYTKGQWVDCGAPTLVPFADSSYRNLNNWTTNDAHKGVFEGKIAYDEASGTNTLNPYVGTGGWEPLYKKVEGFTKGADYNISFKYSGTQWNSWNEGSYAFLPFNVLNNENFGHSDFYPSVGGGILVSAHLPKAETTNLAISEDFTAEQEFEMLLIQFGVVDDGDKGFHFNFDDIQINQYQYADEYPEPTVEITVTPTRYDVNGIGYMPFTGGNGWGDAPFANILDNNADTKFGGNSDQVWAVIVASEPVAVKQYSIVTGGDTYNYTGRNPRSWKVEGSNDNKNWTLIDEQVDDHSIGLVNREEFVFPVNDETKYKYFRYTTTRGIDGTQIGEFWINEQAHTWGDAQKTEATCAVDGKIVYECTDCHALKTEVIPATGNHEFVDGKCSVCGQDEKVIILLPNGQTNPYTAKYLWKNGSENDREIEAGWTTAEFDDSAWGDILMPIGGHGYDGGARAGARYNTNWYDEYNTYWLRRTFELEQVPNGKYEIKVLHDDDYAVYVNGTLVDEATGWTNGTNWVTVNVDQSLLKAGKNVVAIYQEQNFGGAYHDLSFQVTVEPVAFDEAVDNAAAVAAAAAAGTTDITLKRTVKADTWNTIVLPFNMTQAQIEEVFGEGAHIAGVNAPETDEEAIAFKTTTDGLVAYKSYLIWPTKDITEEQPINLEKVAIAPVQPMVEDPVGGEMEYVFTGSFDRVAPTKWDYFVAANNELKKNANETSKLKAFRAYFKDTREHLPVGDDDIDNPGDVLAKRFTVDGQGTGIILQNGEVETLGNIYTISGQKVDKLQKGVYVVKGKKVVVK